jgi:trehalose synthase
MTTLMALRPARLAGVPRLGGLCRIAAHMSGLVDVPIEALDPHRFESVLSRADYDALVELIARGASELRGRVIWNINSTARGGGVVELLRPLLGYSRGAGIDARWAVISASREFFAVTKRLHDQLHGLEVAGGGLSDEQRLLYQQTLAGSDNAADLVQLVRPQDVVILHDPQTAGLVPAARSTGATVIWRCHVGMDSPEGPVYDAWSFLRPYVLEADAYIFSRATFVWEGLEPEKTVLIHPSIDAFSPKNQDQSPEQSLTILTRAGIIAGDDTEEATFVRFDGSPGRVDRRAEMIQEAPLLPDHRLVMQISRWDMLKDPIGVMQAFAGYIAGEQSVHLLLAGPATGSVTDDPAGATVLAEVHRAWRELPDDARARVHLASLPMEDDEENAAIVNAMQRHSEIVTQKSLAEGFGLTVAEAMWKGSPVVASRIGGIQDQIVDRESGLLISDPQDLEEFGAAVSWLLRNPQAGRLMGEAARQRVREHLLGPHNLARYFELIHGLIADQAPGSTP